MNRGLISRRYAKALLEYAQEHQVSELLSREMTTLYQAFVEEPSLRKAMGSPILEIEQKKHLLLTAVPDSSLYYRRFILLVLKNRRESVLRSIALVYNKLYRESIGVCAGTLTTAVPITEELTTKVQTLFGKVKPGTLQLKNIVDPTIGGGFIFDFDTYRLDASVKTQLQQLKTQFTFSTYNTKES